MSLAIHISEWSKDQSTKVGAVIVDDRNSVISLGWNGFPRDISDDVASRHERPAKYLWTEHAERNAIYNAAASGHSLLGSRIYIPWYPCAECSRAIIQAGIKSVVCYAPDLADSRWGEHFSVSHEMLAEAGIEVVHVQLAAAS